MTLHNIQINEWSWTLDQAFSQWQQKWPTWQWFINEDRAYINADTRRPNEGFCTNYILAYAERYYWEQRANVSTYETRRLPLQIEELFHDNLALPPNPEQCSNSSHCTASHELIDPLNLRQLQERTLNA